VVALGLFFLTLSTFFFGPAPFLVSLHWTRLGAWVSQVTALVIFGLGFCFILVSVLGRKRIKMEKKGRFLLVCGWLS
jgi:hypothetical protein